MASRGFLYFFYTTTFSVVLLLESRSFVLADDINLIFPWHAYLNRAKCYVSNSGISGIFISALSTNDKVYLNFLLKSVRNNNKTRFSVASIRCFSCNKKYYMGTLYSFVDRRKTGNRLTAKSFSTSSKSKNYESAEF